MFISSPLSRHVNETISTTWNLAHNCCWLHMIHPSHTDRSLAIAIESSSVEIRYRNPWKSQQRSLIFWGDGDGWAQERNGEELGNTGCWLISRFLEKQIKKNSANKTSHKKHLCSLYTMVNLKMLLLNCVFIYISFLLYFFPLFITIQCASLIFISETNSPGFCVMRKRAPPHSRRKKKP